MEEDFHNYSVTVENPVHTVYRGKHLTTATQTLVHLARVEIKAVLSHLQKRPPRNFLLLPDDTDA